MSKTSSTGFKLITLRESAKIADIPANALYERPEDSATYGPFALAILVFLSACLNFSNTTVSQANRRLKEIGMRKVMGSMKSATVPGTDKMLGDASIFLAIMFGLLGFLGLAAGSAPR